MVTTTAETQLSPEELQQGWRDAHVKPLWEIAQAHAPDGDLGKPVLWAWRTMEPLVQRAIALTSPAVAERRVLSFIDPAAHEGEFHTISNLNAALQILLPGEVARPHRHSPDALRFVLEGGGAITKVDGTLASMEFGDLVLTPGWCWHEHWHDGTTPMVWLDVLNVHTHLHMGTCSFEPGPVHDVPPPVDSSGFISANVIPDLPASNVSPVFRYPLSEAKRALDASAPARDGARRVRYVNPLTAGPVMPLIDCYLVRLDPGVTTLPFRTSAHTICAVVEGTGSTTAGSGTIKWEPRDVFTLPHRAAVTHTAETTSYLFVVTDREILLRLGLLEEKVG
jgi:gentisate 1,2-dioxygenase